MSILGSDPFFPPINKDEELEAEGTFDFQEVVRNSTGVYLNDQTVRVTGTIDSIDGPHIVGAIKSGYWSGSNWLYPKGHFPKDEAECEIHETRPGFLGVYSHYGIVLFRKASTAKAVTNRAENNGQSNPYQVYGIDPSDTLSMRTAAGAGQILVALIPSDADDIEITGPGVMVGSDQWVPVRWRDKEGWVSRKYLAPSGQR